MSFIFGMDEEVFASVTSQRNVRTSVIEPFVSAPAGIRYGGTNHWVNDDPRPTKEEAKERLDGLWFIQVPTRALKKTKFIPPYLVPVLYAPELAEVLIEIDPLDRLED